MLTSLSKIFENTLNHFQAVPHPAGKFQGFTDKFKGLAGIPALGSTSGGVAFWAHVGGFLAGVALVFPFRNPHRVAAHRRHLELARTQRWE